MNRVAVIYPSGNVFLCSMDDETLADSYLTTESVGTVIVEGAPVKRSGYVYQDWVNRVIYLFDVLDYPVCEKPTLQQAKKCVVSDL